MRNGMVSWDSYFHGTESSEIWLKRETLFHHFDWNGANCFRKHTTETQKWLARNRKHDVCFIYQVTETRKSILWNGNHNVKLSTIHEKQVMKHDSTLWFSLFVSWFKHLISWFTVVISWIMRCFSRSVSWITRFTKPSWAGTLEFCGGIIITNTDTVVCVLVIYLLFGFIVLITNLLNCLGLFVQRDELET